MLLSFSGGTNGKSRNVQEEFEDAQEGIEKTHEQKDSRKEIWHKKSV